MYVMINMLGNDHAYLDMFECVIMVCLGFMFILCIALAWLGFDWHDGHGHEYDQW